MFEFIHNQILFYLAIAIVLFIPGYFLLLAVFGKDEKQISSLERFIFSFGLGIIVTNFIAFLFSKLNILITPLSSILGALIFSAVCFGIYKYSVITSGSVASRTNNSEIAASPTAPRNDNSLFSFSRNQLILIFVLLFLTIFIKAAYLTNTVAPTSTDMGHHMYWTKLMAETGQLPDYEGMPDFIIGEHIALAEVAMISGLDFFSALPVVFLLLVNLLGILTVFVLTLRIFSPPHQLLREGLFQDRNKICESWCGGKNIAILSLLFLGVLFAVASPQAKFVSGGVMGNLFGNFFTPLAFYFYFRAIESLFHIPPRPYSGEDVSSNLETGEGSSSKVFLSLGIFVTFGLFYTHHLTAFIFIFVVTFMTFFFLAINFKDIKIIGKKISKLVFSFPVMTALITGIIFFFFIFTPTYIKGSAVETAVGAPSKSTREGLSLTNLKDSVGEARLALGIIGLAFLLAAYQRKNFGFALVSSWTIMLFIMSTAPQILFVNLPSSRIGNYMSYPLSILSAYGLYSIFKFKNNSQNLVPQKFLKSAFLLVVTFAIASGLKDSAEAFKKSADFTSTLQTFDASAYLLRNTEKNEKLLKDHNYLSGDTWMKLFFMREYTYPLSRSYFKRYEDPTKPREMCTLQMISNPGGHEALDCFSETDVKYIMVNPLYDSSQFGRLKNFDEVYNSGNVAVYYKR